LAREIRRWMIHWCGVMPVEVRGTRQGGDARRAVDDDVIGAAGQLWRFLM
jgi:hypothetical protein